MRARTMIVTAVLTAAIASGMAAQQKGPDDAGGGVADRAYAIGGATCRTRNCKPLLGCLT
jgi:hypothetical protein